MTQGDLFEALGPPPPPETTLAGSQARAAGLVARLLERRICLACGAPAAAFVHRQANPWNVRVSRLVRLGASNDRIRIEVAKCETACVEHVLVLGKRKMLRDRRLPITSVVAKGGDQHDRGVFPIKTGYSRKGSFSGIAAAGGRR